MPISPCIFLKRVFEFVPRSDRHNIPDNTRGIYALLNKKRGDHFDVVYIGCSAGTVAGIWATMKSHDKGKAGWTHFSVFEVHDNISREEIRELEALFLHIYRKDGRANELNLQLRNKKFSKITCELPKQEARANR
jgi:hypothetical protein